MPILGAVFLFVTTAAAANSSLTILPIPTFENCGYYIHYPDSTGVICKVYYKHTDSSTWKQSFTPIFADAHPLDGDTTEFRGSIVGLTDSTTYDLWAVVLTGTDTTAQGDTTFTTWDETPPIQRTHNLTDLYRSGAWNVENLTGADDGWIRILGDDETVIDGGDAWQAMAVSNCHYVIFENIHVTGGTNWGIVTDSTSDHLRFINCDLSGWGRATAYLGNDGYYDSDSNKIQLDHGMLFVCTDNLVVERCRVHDQRGNAATYHPPQIQHGSEGITIMACKSVVLRFNDITGSESHWFEDCVKTLAHDIDGVTCEGFYKDADIYGNLFAFANDDGFEGEGDNVNVRIYRNLVTDVFSGLSDAPNLMGPAYFFRNVIAHMGDSERVSHPAVKLGGGTTFSKGRAFWFHNTFVAGADILTGVGYGNDGPRVKEKFLGTSRNNTFWSTSDGYAIDDVYEEPEPLGYGGSSVNDFDYDLLHNTIRAKDGSESHGMYSTPTWTDSASHIFTYQAGSKGIDSGTVVLNFSDGYSGSAPDVGAFEYGENGMTPYRPIDVSASKYRVVTSGAIPQTITFTVGSLEDSTYTVEQSTTLDWVRVLPASGKLTNGTTLTVIADPRAFFTTQRGIVFVRLGNGYSIPISVLAHGGIKGDQPIQFLSFDGIPVKYLFVILASIWGAMEILLYARRRNQDHDDFEYRRL